MPSHVVPLADLPALLGELDPAAFLSLGLLVLIATPFVRVAGSIIAFARERDRRYVLITAVVLRGHVPQRGARQGLSARPAAAAAPLRSEGAGGSGVEAAHGGGGAAAGGHRALDRRRVPVVAAHEQAFAQAHRPLGGGECGRRLRRERERDAVDAEQRPAVDLGAEPAAHLGADGGVELVVG